MTHEWNAHVAPIVGADLATKPWEGIQPRKPWEYPITAAIVHRNTPDLLGAVLATLRAQTVRPYLIVVDTGSDEASCAELDRMEQASEDLEVHYLRARAWRATSQPVTAAMDLAFSLCQSEYCYATHTDVFLKRPDYLAYLLTLCDAWTPAVGFQMSPRPAWPDESWQGILSHTASLYHMPTMRRVGVTWSLLAAFDKLGVDAHNPHDTGYPDTEVHPGMVLDAAGYPARWIDAWHDGGRRQLMLGPEPNEPYENAWLTHVRSSGSAAVYYQGTLQHLMRQWRNNQEIAAAHARALDWLSGVWATVGPPPERYARVPYTQGWLP